MNLRRRKSNPARYVILHSHSTIHEKVSPGFRLFSDSGSGRQLDVGSGGGSPGFEGASRKVGFGSGSSEISGSFVVFFRCLLASIEGAQPQAIFTEGISYLRGVSTPRPPSHSYVMHILGGNGIVSLVVNIALSISGSHGGLGLPYRWIDNEGR
jgi:hypothetical protein